MTLGPWVRNVAGAFLPVPVVPQRSDYSCGAAALAMVLRYWYGDRVDERSLRDPLSTTSSRGTDPRDIVALAREAGLFARYETDMTLGALRPHLALGRTVVASLQAWARAREPDWGGDWTDGHYAVVVAAEPDRVVLADPATPGAYAWVPSAEFAARWHDLDAGRHTRGGAVIAWGSWAPAGADPAPGRAPLVRMR